ncbi:hypothetical protein [Metabacillus malikii]|uniref:DUF8042 domain-containing protein n=1 Tax=Metabacillus malikii TaxID=1504265 RepID=A0ABT9ZGS1_9BACI|nr:hypothetical protein [Metabacillus malikii]MDQ0231467.1 hypothetical protein [Metabacillus malikii]
MVSLTNQQVELLHFYYYLLDTIEDGFDYITASYTNLELNESERLFKDILSAFYHIDSSHIVIEAIFEDDDKIRTSIHHFDVIINILETEPVNTQSYTNPHFIKNELIPAYQAWKEPIQTNLSKYIIQ